MNMLIVLIDFSVQIPYVSGIFQESAIHRRMKSMGPSEKRNQWVVEGEINGSGRHFTNPQSI